MSSAMGGDRPDSGDRSGWTPADWTAHRLELNRKLRAAFLAGAEERSRTAHGRGLTDEELRSVMQQYPGDLPAEP